MANTDRLSMLERWADGMEKLEQYYEGKYGPPATPAQLPPITTYDAMLEAIADGMERAKRNINKKSPTYHSDSVAYVKTVPSGDVHYASLEQIGGRTVAWNQLVDSGTTTVATISGHKYYTLISGTASIVTADGTAITIVDDTADMVTDLTLCFGSGNEPATTNDFTAIFGATHYPYNAGALLSAGVTEVKSVGINVWDEQWENGVINAQGTVVPNNNLIVSKNYIDVSLSDTYYFQFPNTSGAKLYIAGYDADKNFVKFLPSSSGISYANDVIIPAKVYFVKINMGSAYGNTYHNDICINVSNASYNGNYYPYNGHTYPIPAEVQALEGYGWSAGSVSNYIDFERKVFVQRVASVDLGTLNWTYSGSWFYSNSLASVIKPCAGTSVVGNLLTAPYPTVSYSTLTGGADKTISYGRSTQPMNYVMVRDSAYTTDVAFTSAMSGVYLYYELATPQETDISQYLTDDNLISVEAGGSLTFPNSNGDDYRIDVPSSVTFVVGEP